MLTFIYLCDTITKNKHMKGNKSSFESLQKERIIERLHRYNDPKTVKLQLQELGEMTLYQQYKTSKVSKYLRIAVGKIEDGTYGICVVCKEPVSKERLILVPAALACVKCDNKRET